MKKEHPVWRRRGHVHTYCYDNSAISFLDAGLSPADWFAQNTRKLRVDSKKATGLVYDQNNKVMFVKRFHLSCLWQRLLYTFGRDQTKRTFQISWDLLEAGISVPVPLAVVRDLGGIKKALYFICEALPHALPLGTAMDQKITTETQEDYLEYLAKIIAKMHTSGFFHGDLKWNNILIDPEDLQAVHFTDLDGSGRLKGINKKKYAKDISRFCIDIYENLNDQKQVHSFITAYARHRALNPGQVIEDMRPYHRRRSAKKKASKGIDVPPLTLKT